jgi:hypothetical protein
VSRALAALAAQAVGRIVSLHPDGRRGVIIRVTGRGYVVRLANGKDRTGVLAEDIRAWED